MPIGLTSCRAVPVRPVPTFVVNRLTVTVVAVPLELSSVVTVVPAGKLGPVGVVVGRAVGDDFRRTVVLGGGGLTIRVTEALGVLIMPRTGVDKLALEMEVLVDVGLGTLTISPGAEVILSGLGTGGNADLMSDALGVGAEGMRTGALPAVIAAAVGGPEIRLLSISPLSVCLPLLAVSPLKGILPWANARLISPVLQAVVGAKKVRLSTNPLNMLLIPPVATIMHRSSNGHLFAMVIIPSAVPLSRVLLLIRTARSRLLVPILQVNLVALRSLRPFCIRGVLRNVPILS